ncbi:putative syntaxin domain-containing protein [Helianthus annuus]|nr:putative syntaxin domain-containing protein [Helianthus annuus]
MRMTMTKSLPSSATIWFDIIRRHEWSRWFEWENPVEDVLTVGMGGDDCEPFENPRDQQYGGGDLEMGTQHNANFGELGLLDEFFKKDAHEESKGVTKAAAMKYVDEVGKVARFIKSKIEKLDKEKPGCGKGTRVDRSRTVTTISLKKKFKDKMSEFQAKRDIYQEHREVVERRIYKGFELNLNIKIIVGNLRFPNHIYYIA